MSEKTDNFIKTMAALARNEYMNRDKWVLPSVCIAQAALESGWNLEAKTLFGIKGKGFVATTGEYYDGHYVEIQDSFRSYPNAASAVVGYYDFLATTPRYAGVICNSDYKDTVDKLIHTTDGAAYATDPDYISKVVNIIEKYNLTKYDTRDNSASISTADECANDTNVPSFEAYMVKVDINNLNIRKGPGTNYRTNGKTGKGIFTIVDEKGGAGSDSGWGKLKSGAGWISLDFCKRL